MHKVTIGTNDPVLPFDQVTRVLAAVKQEIGDSVVKSPITDTEIEIKDIISKEMKKRFQI